MRGFASTMREKHDALLSLASEAYAAVEAGERSASLEKLQREIVAHHIALQEAVYAALYPEVGKRGKFVIEKLIEQEGVIGRQLKIIQDTDPNELIWLVRLDVLVDMLVKHFNTVEEEIIRRIKKRFNKAGRENIVRSYHKEYSHALGLGALEMSEVMLDKYRDTVAKEEVLEAEEEKAALGSEDGDEVPVEPTSLKARVNENDVARQEELESKAVFETEQDSIDELAE